MYAYFTCIIIYIAYAYVYVYMYMWIHVYSCTSGYSAYSFYVYFKLGWLPNVAYNITYFVVVAIQSINSLWEYKISLYSVSCWDPPIVFYHWYGIVCVQCMIAREWFGVEGGGGIKRIRERERERRQSVSKLLYTHNTIVKLYGSICFSSTNRAFSTFSLVCISWIL